MHIFAECEEETWQNQNLLYRLAKFVFLATLMDFCLFNPEVKKKKIFKKRIKNSNVMASRVPGS